MMAVLIVAAQPRQTHPYISEFARYCTLQSGIFIYEWILVIFLTSQLFIFSTISNSIAYFLICIQAKQNSSTSAKLEVVTYWLNKVFSSLNLNINFY